MSALWTGQADARLTAAGKALEYRCWGPPPDQAPTLVLLHEGLGSVALWRDVPERLAQATGLGVVAYARAGYGGSDPVDLPRSLDYMTREAVHSLPQVLDQLGLRRAVLIGHSDGASIAAIHAGSVGDARLAGLVLIAPHFFTEAVGLGAIAETGGFYETSGLRAKLARYHAHVDTAFYGWHDAWLDPGFEDWNITDVIARWQVPALAIQGTADPYGTLAQIEAISQRVRVPFQTRILPDCGHAPHLEFPVETDAAIVDFCASLALG